MLTFVDLKPFAEKYGPDMPGLVFFVLFYEDRFCQTKPRALMS